MILAKKKGGNRLNACFDFIAVQASQRGLKKRGDGVKYDVRNGLANVANLVRIASRL